MTLSLYELELEERIRTSSVEELQIILGFFDCSRLRAHHVELVRMLREEIARRGGSAH
jgi:hypothetical protein